MSQSNKVSLYNQSDLKNNTDDAIPNYLNSLNFKQIHFLADVRLAMGYGAFLIAVACFAWDYYLGFERTKTWTLSAVGCYAVLNYGMMKWQKDVEKGQVYLATSPDGKHEISIASSSKKQTHMYTLEIAVTEIVDEPEQAAPVQAAPEQEETGHFATEEEAAEHVATEHVATEQQGPKPIVTKFERSFTNWFDESGLFVAQPFQELLATTIPLIGKYDPKRVITSSQTMLDANPELLDAVLAGSPAEVVAVETTGSQAAAKKGSKKRRN